MPRHYYPQELASIAVLITSIYCHCLHADETAKALTVREVVAQTLTENPELKFFESEVAAARGERRATGQWKNPEITVEYGEKRESDRDRNLITNDPVLQVETVKEDSP